MLRPLLEGWEYGDCFVKNKPRILEVQDIIGDYFLKRCRSKDIAVLSCGILF